MSYFGNLSLSVTRHARNVAMGAATAEVNGLALHAGRVGGGVVKWYVSRSYKSALRYEAERAVLMAAVKAIYDIVPTIIKNAQHKRIVERDKKIKEVNKSIIENGNAVVENYGYMTTSDTEKEIFALDKFGRKVKTALIMWYTGTETIEYEQVFGRNSSNTYYEDGNIIQKTLGISKKSSEKTRANVQLYHTKDVIAIDLQPKIDCSSSKNVSLTQVQGRDYSRKEIIGNGDVKFSVSGKFVSHNPDVYPQDQVSRFIQIARHNGIIKVNNLIFGQHNVSNIIIQDYSLPQTDFLNEQPYSFSCVAVEPDEEVMAQDSLGTVLYESAAGSLDGWYNNILMQKLVSSAEASASAAIVGLGSMLDKI